MKNSIGKPCEGKLHARFDVGGSDSLRIFVINAGRLSGSTLLFDLKEQSVKLKLCGKKLKSINI